MDATGMSTTGIVATGMDAAGMEATGMSAAGMDATGMNATGMNATGMDATGTGAGAANRAAASRTEADARLLVRPGRTSDVRRIRELIDTYAPERRLLSKATVTLYEQVQEFIVGERAGEVVGCGGLHVMWEDLAEVRTLAVEPSVHGQGIGGVLLDRLIERATRIGVKRVFCLTFETEFFTRHGFHEIEGTPVDHDVFAQLLQSYDEGVAEFLELERVKPNTLGNHRMLRVL
jgi:amino-acid N-acetyltransferase